MSVCKARIANARLRCLAVTYFRMAANDATRDAGENVRCMSFAPARTQLVWCDRVLDVHAMTPSRTLSRSEDGLDQQACSSFFSSGELERSVLCSVASWLCLRELSDKAVLMARSWRGRYARVPTYEMVASLP